MSGIARVIVVVAALALAGCNGGTVDKQALTNDSSTLDSIACEGALLAHDVARGRTTKFFAAPVRTLSSLLRRKVVTESGDSLGRCYDLRGELTATKLRVTGLCVGQSGWLERLGIRDHDAPQTVPWTAVVRIGGKQIIVRDDALA